MALDIKGGLKNTTISTNRYVVVDELLSNAIDSYLIRKNEANDIPALHIEIQLEVINASLFGDDLDLNITCLDNGYGFGNDQVRAFVTKDSTFKDHLSIQGIGKCKGAGRIQFFHFFRKLTIDSSCYSEGEFTRRILSVDENTREISESDFKNSEYSDGELNTIVSLKGLSETARRKFFSKEDMLHYFSAKTVRDYIFIAFLQRFIVLKNIIGEFSVTIRSDSPIETQCEAFSSADLPEPTSVFELPLTCAHGSLCNQSHNLKITRYSFPKTHVISLEHEVALCANSALVESLIKIYLKNATERRRAINDKFELILVESPLLEGKVNEQRDGFIIKKDCTHNGYYDDEFSMQDIIESLEDYVYEVLTPSDFDRDELIRMTGEQFGISQSMINSSNVKIRYTDTTENIAKRVLKKYQEDIVDETSNIFDLKSKLLTLDPREGSFREKLNELSWKYTSTIQKMDMANLSQLVVRRAAMLDVLKYSLNVMLDCQQSSPGKSEHERIIHNVFFPTGKDSREHIDHDIWILNEEYHYFEHIASDKPLASIPWNEEIKLFDADVDSTLEEIYAKNNEKHRLKRPDIAIFNQEGSAIIIEFKAPGVDIQDHVNDLTQYSRLLATKSHGRIKKFYGYLIGDSIDDSRVPGTYKIFPSGKGYFSTEPITIPGTSFLCGELYSEMLLYSDFIERAQNRLDIYKKKLNFSL
ncbi:hypothetical protein [Aeromonas veronii]|uniref:hypothetical protein n=1 Tax=Aeromonas veronii TaxID=654 RepID=UPI0030D0B44D